MGAQIHDIDDQEGITKTVHSPHPFPSRPLKTSFLRFRDGSRSLNSTAPLCAPTSILAPLPIPGPAVGFSAAQWLDLHRNRLAFSPVWAPTIATPPSLWRFSYSSGSGPLGGRGS